MPTKQQLDLLERIQALIDGAKTQQELEQALALLEEYVEINGISSPVPEQEKRVDMFPIRPRYEEW